MHSNTTLPQPPLPQQEEIPQVLIVDDDPEDIELMRIAFELCQFQVHVDAAGDGLLAIQQLRQSVAACHRPRLILLDLHMPRMDGCAVIAGMRCEGLHACIPIVIWSTSQDAADHKRSLMAGATAFHAKPDSVEGLVALARELHGYLR